MNALAERLDTAAADLPYAPLAWGRMDYGARLRVAPRPLDDTDLLAFARLVPAPEPADRTETAQAEGRATTSYVIGSLDEREELEDETVDDNELAEALRVGAVRRDLLARRFARRHMSPEYLARLEILDERLRALTPRVTEHALEVLEDARRQMESADDLLERVRRELSTDE